MNNQRYNGHDNYGGGQSQQTSWDAGIPEPSPQRNGGWDQNFHSGASSRGPSRAAPTNPAAGYVDVGYFDQRISILGTFVTVRVAYTARGVDNWIDECPANETIFGFDIEWRPNHQKGDDNYAALCQISSATKCLIIQLMYLDFIPDKLKVFLADPRKRLAGVGVKGDINKLKEDYGLRCRGEVDLSTYAATVYNDPSLKQLGLAALCGRILGIPHKKSKRVTMSTWDVQSLSYNQIVYAATDAWISYSLLVSLETHQREMSLSGRNRAEPIVHTAGYAVVVQADEASGIRSQRRPF